MEMSKEIEQIVEKKLMDSVELIIIKIILDIVGTDSLFLCSF